jgi:hypothetical protein
MPAVRVCVVWEMNGRYLFKFVEINGLTFLLRDPTLELHLPYRFNLLVQAHFVRTTIGIKDDLCRAKRERFRRLSQILSAPNLRLKPKFHRVIECSSARLFV